MKKLKLPTYRPSPRPDIFAIFEDHHEAGVSHRFFWSRERRDAHLKEIIEEYINEADESVKTSTIHHIRSLLEAGRIEEAWKCEDFIRNLKNPDDYFYLYEEKIPIGVVYELARFINNEHCRRMSYTRIKRPDRPALRRQNRTISRHMADGRHDRGYAKPETHLEPFTINFVSGSPCEPFANLTKRRQRDIANILQRFSPLVPAITSADEVRFFTAASSLSPRTQKRIKQGLKKHSAK